MFSLRKPYAGLAIISRKTKARVARKGNACFIILYRLSIHFDVFFALCADGYILDFATDRFFEVLYILQRVLGQIFFLAALRDVAVDPVEIFVTRLCVFAVFAERERLYALAV